MFKINLLNSLSENVRLPQKCDGKLDGQTDKQTHPFMWKTDEKLTSGNRFAIGELCEIEKKILIDRPVNKIRHS